MPPAKTGKKQAGQFAKGKSGNPNGRPQGSRNAATLALESLLDGQAEALTQKAIDLALAGDLGALRISWTPVRTSFSSSGSKAGCISEIGRAHV